MRSPFAIFRKHQKLLTVLLTGLAMFAFVILGAVNDPTNMPPALIVMVIACVFGGIGWLLGTRNKKMAEYGTAGLLLGAVVGVGATMLGGPPVKVKADTGNLNVQEFNSLQYQRSVANQFLMLAAMRAREKSGNQFFRQPAQFGFLQDPEKDIVLGELLRREAHDLGIVVTDGTVNDFISAISEQRLGATDIKEIRQQMGVSESDLYNSLRAELQARLAAQFLYGDTILPPEAYWEFYEQMNVRESVGIAPIPVSAFIDSSAEPSESELQQLFDAHRTNYPNFTEDGRLDEGLPGFRQPRRVRLAYVEAAYEQIEKLVTPPTDDEIEAFYQEHNKTIPVAPSTGEGGPELPAPAADDPAPSGEIDGEDLPPGDAKPEEDTPADAKPNEESPTEDKPTGEKPAEETSDEDAPAEEKPAADEPAEEKPAEPPAESRDLQSRIDFPQRSGAVTQYVAFYQEESGKDAEPAEPATAVESEPAGQAEPATATEASESAEPPAEEATAEPATPEGTSPPAPPVAPDAAEATPAVPDSSSAPALDETRRSEIRDQLLRERTAEKMREVISEVHNFMRELEVRRMNLPDEEDYLTSEQALEELRKFAEEKGLTFVETPPLSVLDLVNSEEYPIGSAVQEMFADPFDPRPSSTVVDQVFNSAPTEKFRLQTVVDPETQSEFVYWKIDDLEEFEPKSLSDPGIREQVVQAWRELKAREKAKARAEELAKLANETDKPLGEVLAGQTVTGAADAAALSVLHPPKFAWLSKADPRLSPNPWSTPPPERTRLRNVPGRIGDSFMKTIFDELKPGEVGVAHSIDQDYFYVVRVDERSYTNNEEMQVFREKFLREPVFAPIYASDYPKLAQTKLQSYHTDLSDSLFKKYGVEILETEQPRAPIAESEAPPPVFY